MKKKKRKITKKRKKFFIILSCYIATFVITAVVTLSTLAWFNGSTHADNVLYMGGPVYIHFSDDEGISEKRGAGALVVNMPPNWEKLYPGMNIEFEARAIIEGASWQKEVPVNDTITIYTTGAILRARIMLTITDPSGDVIYPLPEGVEDQGNTVSKDIYDWIWPQLQDEAVTDTSEEGMWVFDEVDEFPEDNYFYYVKKGQSTQPSGNYQLLEVGGVESDVSVGFLNKAVVTLPGVPLTNVHSDCKIKFTIVFHALQAFLPYEEDEIGNDYLGDTTGRSDKITRDDIGTPKPLTIANSRSYYSEAFAPLYPGQEGTL